MRNECMMVSIAIAVFACLFLCTLAMADYNYAGWQVTNRVNGTVNGGVFFDYEPWPGPQTAGTMNLNASFDVPSGTVKHAFLYTGIWGGNPTSTYWHNVTFNGNYTANGLGPIHVEGNSDTNPNVWASGCGKHWWWYDVTNLTNAGATNTARTKKINGTGCNDGRVYGILLVVVYEGGDDPKNVSYWLNDGCDALYDDTHDWGTTNFSGMVDNCSVTDANLTVAWMTAALWCDDCANFSDHTLDTSMVQSDTFQMTTWNVTSYVKSSGNDAWYGRGWDGYVSVPNAILVLERGALPSVFDTGLGTYPSIRGTHNGTLRLNQTMVVNRMYTYSCFKTDGHSEYVAFYNSTTGEEIANGTWIGTYLGPYQWINFDEPFTLYKDIPYNYTIVTGSYPQIIHEPELITPDGKITCTKFTDANGKVYYDWIPAIKLYE